MRRPTAVQWMATAALVVTAVYVFYKIPRGTALESKIVSITDLIKDEDLQLPSKPAVIKQLFLKLNASTDHGGKGDNLDGDLTSWGEHKGNNYDLYSVIQQSFTDEGGEERTTSKSADTALDQLSEGSGEDENTDEFDVDEDEELEAIVNALQSNKTVYTGNTILQEYYNHPLLTICELQGPIPPNLRTPFNMTMTIENCRKICAEKATIYATLQRGNCYCSHIPHNVKKSKILDLEACQATCAADDLTCVESERPHSITMKTGLQDGNSEWTVWMYISDLKIKVRYRGCPRSKDKETLCNPEFQRNHYDAQPNGMLADKLAIGCFTKLTILTKTEIVFQSALRNTFEISEECIKTCKTHRTTYAVMDIGRSSKAKLRQCYCVNTLSRSRPSTQCSALSLTVFWASDVQSQISLKFKGETVKKGKVLIIARYRSGSSMTQSFFVKNPKSFTLFETGKLKTNPAQAKSDRAMLMALEAFYRCDIQKIPASFHNSNFILWSKRMLLTRGQGYNYMDEVLKCLASRDKNCAPYWQEACEQSEFMNVKVIRVFTAEAIKEFIRRNSDVHVVHLVRDPRGLLSAQKSFGSHLTAEFVCNQLVAVGQIFKELSEEGSKTSHEVYYEQLAINASYYGAKIYSEMGIEMPEQVAHFLSREDYSGEKIPRAAQQVIRKNPELHLYKYLQKFNIDKILDIDKYCRNVYNFWPDHYSEFWTVYRNHKEEVDRYISPRHRIPLQQYVKEHKIIL